MLTGTWKSLGPVKCIYTDDGWTAAVAYDTGMWAVYRPRRGAYAQTGTGGRPACVAWLRSDEGRKWYRLPDEVPSRADIRPPASLADATAVRMVAALLRDLAESQRANREAAEILRAVGTERALEAAEKCEANS